MKRICWIIFCILFLGSSGLYAQLLAVKTDAFMDCAMTPNLNLELVTGEKTSINATVFGNYKPWGTDMKIIGGMPELRYWFNGRPLTREFIGLSGIAAVYDITWSGERYKGDALGVGLTFGYAFYLSRRWSVECHGGFGAVLYSQTRSYIKDNYSVDYHNARGYSLLPYKLGVSIVYILK